MTNTNGRHHVVYELSRILQRSVERRAGSYRPDPEKKRPVETGPTREKWLLSAVVLGCVFIEELSKMSRRR